VCWACWPGERCDCDAPQAGAAAGFALSRAKGWQNTLRALMGMEPTQGDGAFTIAFIELAVFVLLLLLFRAFRGT
jgi:uncharacterized membrane protein